jgi:predicted enzyme related to lactoylglutathione lyase
LPFAFSGVIQGRMLIKKIAFTMYPVEDMARARKFYEGVLGLKKTENFRGEWLEYDLAGGCFAITTMLKGQVKPSTNSGGSISFEVADVGEATEHVRKAGYPVYLDVMQTPVCRMSVVGDGEGNSVSLHQVTA